MTHFRLAGRLNLCDLPLLILAPLCQLIHNVLIQFRIKKSSENNLFFIGFCPKQSHKFPLRDHGHLHKLALCQSYNFLQFLICLLRRIFHSIRHNKRHTAALFLKSGAPFQRTNMLRHTPNCIMHILAAFTLQKNQFHKGFH